MNREIKFRCWHAGEMWQADRIQFVDGDGVGADGVRALALDEVVREGGGEVHHELTWIVLSGPVMQYTGLKDKNGKEIYEGDIVQYILDNPDNLSTRYTEEVSYQGSGFCVDGYCPVDATTDWEVEVIGNVHENPDLLKTQ